jgi:hypothetical protein
MIVPVLFLIVALAWGVAVTDAVIESAQVDAERIIAFGRVLFDPGSVEDGILILCALSATAALAVVIAVSWVRGRRLERRMAAELDERIATRSVADAGDAAVSRLMEHRVDELQTSVDTLTAQRDAIYEEIQSLRAMRKAIPVISIPDADEPGDRPPRPPAPASRDTGV